MNKWRGHLCLCVQCLHILLASGHCGCMYVCTYAYMYVCTYHTRCTYIRTYVHTVHTYVEELLLKVNLVILVCVVRLV